MTDEPDPSDTANAAEATDATTEETWRTMAGLLGRAWLARQSASRSGARREEEPGDRDRSSTPAPPFVAPLAPAARVPYPRWTHRAGGHAPVGGVASFVVDVASTQPPLDPEAHGGKERVLWGREHRGIHCRTGLVHPHASHNPCQRPAMLL